MPLEQALVPAVPLSQLSPVAGPCRERSCREAAALPCPRRSQPGIRCPAQLEPPPALPHRDCAQGTCSSLICNTRGPSALCEIAGKDLHVTFLHSDSCLDLFQVNKSSTEWAPQFKVKTHSSCYSGAPMSSTGFKQNLKSQVLMDQSSEEKSSLRGSPGIIWIRDEQSFQVS